MELSVNRILLIVVCFLVARCRAAVSLRDTSRLWPSEVIKFGFDDNVDSEARDDVVAALRHIRNETCLGFIFSQSAVTGLVFRSDLNRCYKTKIGYRGPGKHSVYVNRDCPGSIPLRSQVIHEVGHALGLADEYNRPDRNRFLRVRLSNVAQSNRTKFNKLSWRKVDPLEQDFDRSSIMQYGSNFLSKNGRETISTLSNPGLIPGTTLSPGDVKSLMMMYRCPFRAQSMRLSLEVIARKRLQNDVVVSFEVSDTTPGRFPPIIRSSGAPRGSGPLKLPGPIDFGVGTWVALKIRVSKLSDDATEVFIPYSRLQIIHRDYVVKLCRTPYSCSRSVSVRIIAEPATNYCYPSPCMNDGRCRSGANDPICECRPGFYGKFCQKRFGSLKVDVKHGMNLRRFDATTPSDPFVLVRAYRADGTYLERKTRTIMDNELNPVWNETLEFGVDWWEKIILTVFDDNTFIYPQPIISNERVSLMNSVFSMGGTPVGFKMHDQHHPTPSQSFVEYTVSFTAVSDNFSPPDANKNVILP
ncbi:hypothetical protein NDN08_002107 [Rhodosorus marinus]|uniref:Metalloendopeptidase n=1 Tax=Rhodosorus marinus TaxID=101924 RepID=A0AAV8USS7_9RHOD|nr:hypothetical protein NDN08_002107 [Rhodosorus marinus]